MDKMNAKANKKVEAKDGPLFVGISSPENVRASLLESSKDLLVILKQIEEIKVIRDKKKLKIEEMTSKLRSISASLNRLKRTVPSIVAVDKKIVPVKEEVSKIVVKKKVEPVLEKSKTELERLEDEISLIESKLVKN